MIFPQFQCALALFLGKRAGGLAQVMNEINPVASDKLTFNRNALVLCFVSRESFMQLNNEHEGGGADGERSGDGVVRTDSDGEGYGDGGGDAGSDGAADA